MSEKYYIPQSEEFHIGFEYEINQFPLATTNKVDKWVPVKIRHSGDFPDESFFINGEYRCKFLDKQDIEDLGWVCIDKEKQFYDYNPNNSPDFCRFALDVNSNNRINIWDNENEVSFAGDIKNKAELKKIMKQLGIL